MVQRTWLRIQKREKLLSTGNDAKGVISASVSCPNNRIEVDASLNQKGYSPARFKETVNEGEKGCTGCAQCATVCPDVAIEVYRAK